MEALEIVLYSPPTRPLPLPAASKNKFIEHICFSFYNGSQGLFYVMTVFLLVPPPFPIILFPRESKL